MIFFLIKKNKLIVNNALKIIDKLPVKKTEKAMPPKLIIKM